MRITIYKIELNNDLHTKLVKEKAYNHDVKNLNNPSSIVQVMNDVFHMNKLSEEYLYTIALNRKLKPIGFFEISHGTSDCSLCNPREILIDCCYVVLTHLYYYIIIQAVIHLLVKKILRHLKE